MTDPFNARLGLDHRTVWRWHFYAGLIAIPFVMVLSLSGGLYLFRPQFEAWFDRPYDRLPDAAPRQSAATIVGAAIAATPGGSLNAYELPPSDDAAARVLLNTPPGVRRVYVHPRTLAVLTAVQEEDRPMRWLFRLHGELLMGDPGSYVVEIAASWAVVLILTGVWLWWPRGRSGWGGVVYPRLWSGGRVFWRDAHAVTGVWVSGLVLVLLASGLPWAKFWGDYFRFVRTSLHAGTVTQDWTNGAAPRPAGGETHAMHGGHAMTATTFDPAALDRVVATVAPLPLIAPVQVKPPAGRATDWKVMSLAADRPLREELTVAADGRVVRRSGFADKAWPDRVVGVGVAWHEGQLFGWPNQLLGLVAVLGLMLICVSAIALWWRRRPLGVLGAPAAAEGRGGGVVVAVVVLLGVLLPLFAASLVLVRLIEVGVLRRIGPARRWLGLSGPFSRALTAEG